LPIVAAAALLAAGASGARADQPAAADVVVVVDTSTSMREPGMDPQRTSLLVSKLLADISPGSLAVVRLLDLHDDADVLPSRNTGTFMPCSEDPTRQCERVDAANDWWAEARRRQLGALVRPAPTDAAYKRSLEGHLSQRIHNSLFDLALRAAQGVLEQRRGGRPAGTGVPQTVIWLSDGRSDNESLVEEAVRDLARAGVAVEAIVFGRGDTGLPLRLGLPTHQAKTPAELMRAFAGAFRRIVQAPYEMDALLASAPTFEMKRGVDEAWIVVYGDDTLSHAELEGPAGVVAADRAADRWPGAGAYRVAYLQRPPAGSWRIRASGGGPGTAYAVVQRSALAPVLLAPARAISGAPVIVEAAVVAGPGEPIREPTTLGEVTLTAEIAGSTVALHDDGRDGDRRQGDGRFSGRATFRGLGRQPVRLHLVTPLVDRSAKASVEVSGRFLSDGKPIEVDLGQLGPGSEVCRPLRLAAVHDGQVPFVVEALARPPGGHTLSLRLPKGRLRSGDEPRLVGPHDALAVCLATGPRVASSTAGGEPWLALAVPASRDARQRVTIRLRWRVDGLGFWARWWWLVVLVAVALLTAFVVAGYVVPARFQPSLALAFAPDRDELDEQSPQPLRQWRGVGIGFYRDARAFLHADFRLSGNPRGALAALEALRSGTRVLPGRGVSLQREALDGGWEPVDAGGRNARAGDIYRIGDRGPFFRLTARRASE
jgi:hypothetical protein